MSAVRRIRQQAGHVGLLAVLAAVAAFLITAGPRRANELADAGLRADVEKVAWSARDVTYVGRWDQPGGPGQLESLRKSFAQPLAGLIGDRWYATEAGPGGMGDGSCPPEVAVRWETGTDKAIELTEGELPDSAQYSEAMADADTAEALGLKVGQLIPLETRNGSTQVRISGFFTIKNAEDPIWDDMRLHKVACPNPLDGTRTSATLLTDQTGAVTAATATGSGQRLWRYRLDTNRLTAADADGVTTAVVAARRAASHGVRLQTSLDATLTTYGKQNDGVRSLLAVVQAGVLATVAGLILLAARLWSERRRDEFVLLRARGASAGQLARRTLGETAVAVPVASAAGWALGTLVAGRPASGSTVLVVVVGLLALLAGPAFAARPQRFGARRPDAEKPSPRRLTAEASVLLLAALGLVLLRRRGLDTGAGVDPFLVVVPVLFALATALLVLRLTPFPVRWFGRLAARGRGITAFLGLAGAGRGAPLGAGPVAVLVVALATGIFTGAVAGTVGHARDVAADREVPAAARVEGYLFAPDTAARVAALPGTGKVVPMLVAPGSALRTRTVLAQAEVLVVDASNAGLDLPDVLVKARPGSGPVPALVSPDLAKQVGSAGTVTVQGRDYAFTVAAVRDAAPGIEVGARHFVVLPWQALQIPAYQPLLPNRLLLGSGGFDAEAVRTTVDDGQKQQLTKLTGQPVKDWQLNQPATVTTRQQYRQSLDDTGVNGVLTFTFVAGVAATGVLALLAVAFAVLAGAPARGRTRSRLRTMGLGAGQARRLLLVEIAPIIGAAVLAGALAGIALPVIAGPALALDGFTSGIPAGLHLDPLLAGAVVAVAVLALAAALTAEHLADRRSRLGTVLRLGEEN